MERALDHRLLGTTTAHRQLLAVLDAQLPRLRRPASAAAWQRRARSARAAALDVIFRGHPKDVVAAAPRVVWGDVLTPGPGYRIRKLRYEGYPGLWVPALLYEPTGLRGRVPAVLNPNGHHVGGKAMAYKQARCINLAKRGMLALNTEFIGMGELVADADHNRISLLDLCGVAGIGVFYLLMKRGLDVLLAHRHVDPTRVAMTGLSGGGWQTALLSALDERITVPMPVAGHSPLWQRRGCVEDIGDLEQCPTDLATAADYDVLTGMFAPRPTLLIYNHDDDCCFQTKRARASIYRPARAVYETLGVADRIAFHDNLDPGTHNYDADNRRACYRFLDRCFGLDTADGDLPWADELLSEDELRVGLPADNATLHSLALDRLRGLRRRPARGRRPTDRVARQRLAQVLRLPTYEVGRTASKGGATREEGTVARGHVLGVGPWSLAATEIAPEGRTRGVEIVLAEAGRRHAGTLSRQALARGHRVLAVDLFGFGESQCSYPFHMLLAAAGQRPLGIMTAQLLAVVDWARRRYRTGAVHVGAGGRVTSVVALLAAALAPQRFAGMTTHGLLDSLGRLVEWPAAYSAHAPLFCFGLLAETDVSDLLRLSAPVPLADTDHRGPLR